MKNKTLLLILLTMLMAPLASKAQETCAAPTGLRLSSVGPYTANLFWNDEDEPYFKYVLREGHNISPATVSFSEAEMMYGQGNYSFSNLHPSTDYTFFLFKVCDVNDHSQPASVEFHTPSCAAPEGLRLGDVGPYSANLLWTDEEGVVFKYVLEYGHHLNLAEVDLSHPDNITTHGNYAFEHLHANTDYTFFLLKQCSGGDYSSASIEFRTGPSCLPPTGLRLQEGSLTAYSANIHWDAEDDDHFSYAVVRGHNIDPETVSNYTQTNLNNQGVTGLDPDTDYTFFLIRRCSASDHSEPAYIEFHTLPSCLPPTGLRVQEGSPTAYAVNLLWNDEDGVGFKYILERTAYINEHPEYVNVSNASTTPYTGNFSYTYLTPDTDYTFFLFKICSGSDHSQPASVEFHTLESCPAPTGLQVVEGSIGAHTATVEWDFVEGVEFLYTWRQGNNTDPTGVAFTWGGFVGTHTITGLTADTDYTFFLKKNCGSNGTNDYSDIVSVVFHTAAPCPTPTFLHVVTNSLTPTGVSMAWDGEEGALFLYTWMEGTNIDPQTVDFLWGGYVNTHTIDDLTPDTYYTFFLRRACANDEYSDIVSLEFHTPCPAPTNLAATNLTSHSATLSWTGTTETYIVEQAFASTMSSTILNEGFEGGTMPENWITIPIDNDDYYWEVGSGIGSNDNPIAPASGNYNVYFHPDQQYDLASILITPSLDLGEAISATLSFKYVNPAWNGAQDELWIKYRVGDGEWQNLVSYTSDQTTWTTCTIQLIGLADDYQIGFFGYSGEHDDYGYGIGLDDIRVDMVSYAYRWSPVTDDATSPYTWNGLDPETTYRVRVTGDCGNGVPSEPLVFTTTSNCPAPDNVSVNNITKNSATVSWEGTTNTYSSYNVMYREVIPGDLHQVFFDSFEGDFSAWTTYALDYSSDETDWHKYNPTPVSPQLHAHTGDYLVMSRSYYGQDYSVDNWLVSPRMTLGDVVKFWVTGGGYAPGQGQVRDHYEVWVSTRTNAVRDFVHIEDPEVAPGYNNWDERTVLLGNYAGQQGYIAIRHYENGQDFIDVDDFGVYNSTNSYGTVHTFTTTTTSCELTGLTPGTLYEVQVQGIDCNDNGGLSEWSTLVNFTTIAPKTFNTEGNWSVASNWLDNALPAADDDVLINANCTLDMNAEVAELTIPQGKVLTIMSEMTLNVTDNLDNYDYSTLIVEDGAQLKMPNAVNVTMKKNITGYNSVTGNGHNWYLIISPIYNASMVIENPGFGIIPEQGDYDLYSFDYREAQEWRNYKVNPHPFTTIQASNSGNLKGYLYASELGTTLCFHGKVYGTYEFFEGFVKTYCVAPTNPANYNFPGWYLIGNGYVCDAYLADSRNYGLPCLVMNADGDGFEAVAAGTPLAPWTGCFFQAETTCDVYVYPTAPNVPNRGNLNMKLHSGDKQLDNAILVFDGNQQLGKFSFRQGSSMIYMPVEGKDLAITSVEGRVGEQPLNFKAEKNGTYTIDFANEDITFSYLHLIDNKTGADVNLLETSNYTFDAKVTDYAQRFRLVFATGTSTDSEAETFGFINGMGNLCIFGIEGEAIVQVVDMMGRVLSSETFSGSYEKKIEGAPGVYMVRLIQGNDVRVQKMVVR